MAHRYLEVRLPEAEGERLAEVLGEVDVEDVAVQRFEGAPVVAKVLVSVDRSQAVIDLLSDEFGGVEGFRLVMLEVEATLPLPEVDEEEPEEGDGEEVDEEPAGWRSKIGRDELYADITDHLELSWPYTVLVVLSSIVAAVGLVRDDQAIIIGAMVIAPLIGPNVAQALATTLGDVSLSVRAAKANLLGVLTVLLLTVPIGRFLAADLGVEALVSRTRVGFGDVALALASGAAGVLSFTQGFSTPLIGVMVAAALLPPLVTTGMFLGAGDGAAAFGAFLLTVTNVICLNLAGVVTFLLQGVQPRTWWEKDRAGRATRLAVLIWGLLLLALMAVVYLTDLEIGFVGD